MAGGFFLNKEPFNGTARIHENDREGLERLLRYCARPPFALERIKQQPDGSLIYQLNKPLANGQTQLKLTSLELIDKLAALVPPPRIHRHRYYGVLAPGIPQLVESPFRVSVTAMAELFKDQSTLLAMAEFVRNDEVKKHLGVTGYGFGLIEYAQGVWGHGGQTLGYESTMMFVPGTDITMVVLTNAAQEPFLQMRSLAPLLQQMAGIQPKPASVFPRPEPNYTGKRDLDFKPFVQAMNILTSNRFSKLDKLLLTASVPEIQQLLTEGKTSSEELAAYYLQRIQSNDWHYFNSVMELNPDLLGDAKRLDSERKAGKPRSPLHGIPVLFKDNIAVKGMHATAGAWAMRNWQPSRDAELVKNLRDAGALILGKTDLSEWANYMDPNMLSGFSVLGGQTRNPYGPFDVSGSSSGSAVAAAANFAPITVGTETQGSIIQPAIMNGVVAIKTSKGLVSGDNIIPLVDWMDVPGPCPWTLRPGLSHRCAGVDHDQRGVRCTGQHEPNNCQKWPGRDFFNP